MNGHQKIDNMRYGFQGQEMDDEIKGEGNSVNYKYRMHDPRIGRFFAVDPLTKKYPFYSPYSFSGNEVIHMVELEGLEPAEAATKDSKYTIANKSGTEDSYGYTSTIGKDGSYSWKQGSSTTFSNGDLTKGSHHDNDKKYFPNQAVNGAITSGYVGDNSETIRLADFTSAFIAGTSGGSSIAKGEAMSLLTNFIKGTWQSKTFGSNSEMSKMLGADPNFKDYATKFEAEALKYFNNNKTLEGFDGKDLMNALGKPYIKDAIFMYTVMGGTQKWKATITSVSSTDIKVSYQVYDRFGAGTDDATRSLPGLSSLYWLQHNSHQHGASWSKYAPFTWSIKVNSSK